MLYKQPINVPLFDSGKYRYFELKFKFPLLSVLIILLAHSVPFTFEKEIIPLLIEYFPSKLYPSPPIVLKSETNVLSFLNFRYYPKIF